MTRRHLAFACEGSALAATLDEAPRRTGLLIVSGGNEVRSGAWSGQALLAAEIAAAGFPVLRFDRRGVGDSDGPNGGFRTSGPDLAAAIAAFRATGVSRVVGFGNCDAASALMLAGGSGFDALVLGNPWTFDEVGDVGGEDATPMPPAALRAHYLRRLTDPRALWRLMTGKVGFGGLASGLAGASRATTRSVLATDMERALAGFSGEVVFVVAGRDRTGQAFLANWNRADHRVRICAGATHSFVEPEARAWLRDEVLNILNAAWYLDVHAESR